MQERQENYTCAALAKARFCRNDPLMIQHATPEPLTMFDKIWMRHRVLEREDGQVLL